jgi:hypothetical protein
MGNNATLQKPWLKSTPVVFISDHLPKINTMHKESNKYTAGVSVNTIVLAVYCTSDVFPCKVIQAISAVTFN